MHDLDFLFSTTKDLELHFGEYHYSIGIWQFMPKTKEIVIIPTRKNISSYSLMEDNKHLAVNVSYKKFIKAMKIIDRAKKSNLFNITFCIYRISRDQYTKDALKAIEQNMYIKDNRGFMDSLIPFLEEQVKNKC